MNLYEHTIVARQDVSPSQIKQLTEKYTKIVEKNDGKVVQTQNWGLINLSYIIKKNKKGNYIHFKFEGPAKIISDLEKNESMDKNLLRYLTVKVKKSVIIETVISIAKDEFVKDILYPPISIFEIVLISNCFNGLSFAAIIINEYLIYLCFSMRRITR